MAKLARRGGGFVVAIALLVGGAGVAYVAGAGAGGSASEGEYSTATSVAVRSFSASRSGAQVVLRWRTASEIGLAGFNVYAGRASGRVRLNRTFFTANGDVGGHRYVWRGRVARANSFWLETVRTDGSRTWWAIRT